MIFAIFLSLFSRKLAQALCLTGSDLNSSSKPWHIQRKTSDVVYAEFHEQVCRIWWTPQYFCQSIYFRNIQKSPILGTGGVVLKQCKNLKSNANFIFHSLFCHQGDVELALGWNPIPLFNRANFPELASMQVPFPSSNDHLVSEPLPWVIWCIWCIWCPCPGLHWSLRCNSCSCRVDDVESLQPQVAQVTPHNCSW